MIVDLILKINRADPFFRRNILKTLSWRFVGSIDTTILSWIITGNLSFGAKIGTAELFTKMLLYYFHERGWQKLTIGNPPRKLTNNLSAQKNSPHLFKNSGKIKRKDREILNKNPAFTLWMTGLSGSGKSTLASELEMWMHQQELRVYLLDGDNTRLGVNSDLSFSNEDRSENIRRVAEICKLFNDAGLSVIASFISPFRQDRLLAKKLIGEESFVEVYVDAKIEICKARDVKGLYKLAMDGKLKNFTGVDSSYETPLKPDIHLKTDQMSIDECVLQMQCFLIKKEYWNNDFSNRELSNQTGNLQLATITN